LGGVGGGGGAAGGGGAGGGGGGGGAPEMYGDLAPRRCFGLSESSGSFPSDLLHKGRMCGPWSRASS
jgi:hypothetical protein